MDEQSPENRWDPRGGAERAEMRYSSLHDYLRVIRRHKWMIALIALAGAAIALAMSLASPKTYEATSQVIFRDVLEDLIPLGVEGNPNESPVVRSAAQAELITRQDVADQVQKELDSSLSTAELTSAIDTQVGVQTNIVKITASAGDPKLAAQLANAFASVTKDVGAKEERDRLDQVEENQLENLKEAQKANELDFPSAREERAAELLSVVQTAKDVAEPVEVVRRAEIPTSQVSPAPKRNTVIGGLLGLVLGLLAAFARDVLDRRLHTPHEVHEELGLPVLGRVSVSAFGYPGLAGNGRLAMPDTDFESFRALRMNIGALGDEEGPPRSILVTSGVPEEGKSTVSMALASAAAITGQRVLLVETDLRRPIFSRRFNIPRAPGLADYLRGETSPPEILQTIELTEPSTVNGGSLTAGPVAGSLICITAGTPVSNPAELLVSERFRYFLEKVTKVYDLVVLDGSPLLAVVDPLEVAPRVDGVLVCVRLRQATREQLRAERAALEPLRDRPMGLVVTGIKRGEAGSYDYYYGY
jgi:capsular exopolysaccharide synthesis family protein